LRLDHRVEAGVGFGGDGCGGDEDAETFGGSSAYSAAELMELREAEAVGVLYDHDSGVGDVDSYFDDRGGDEDVEFAALEAGHGDFFVVGGHAAVE